MKVLRQTTSLLALISMMGAPAFAQRTENSSVNTATAAVPTVEDGQDAAAVGDIVVTAQRREERLKDVPVSVSVTRGESLVKANITSLTDLANQLPGVKISPAPGSNGLHIRGVGSGFNAGFEQSVGTFVDGIYRGRSRAISASLFDLERVEVLRGPQTTFFGNNVIAGALNIVTRKATDRFEGNGTALYSPSDDTYTLEAGINAPITDRLSVRIAGRAYGRNGWAHNVNTDEDVPHERDLIGRISAVWKPVDGLRTDLRVDRGHLRDRGSPVQEGLNCPANPIYGAPAGPCRRYLNSGRAVDGTLNFRVGSMETQTRYDFVEAALTNTIDVGSGTLTSISGYFHHNVQVLSDAAPFPVGGVIPGTTSSLPVNAFEKASQYSQELRFQTDRSKPISFTIGGYYARENLDASSYSGQYVSTLGTSAAPIYNANTPVAARFTFAQKTDNASVFGSITAAIVDGLKLDAGVRYSSIRKHASRTYLYGTAFPFPSPDTFVVGPAAVQTPLYARQGTDGFDYATPKRTDNKLLPSIDLRYEFNPDISAYASYAKGFKAGGYAASSRGYEFSPENADAYEIGLKGSLFDRKLFTTIALFRTDYKDLQEASSVIVGASVVAVIANAAEARSQGVELATSLRASKNLTFRWEVSYVDSKYLNYPTAPCTVLASTQTRNCVQDMSGKRRAFAPKWSGVVGATLTLPFGNDAELKIDPSVFFTSQFFESASADPLLVQPGYAKIDLRVGYGPSDQRWEVAVIGKNLTDKATASYRLGIPLSPGSVAANPEPPRTIAVQMNVRF
ncbi:MAG TPA: TonB-dependent receptor [Sphingobium sp.]